MRYCMFLQYVAICVLEAAEFSLTPNTMYANDISVYEYVNNLSIAWNRTQGKVVYQTAV